MKINFKSQFLSIIFPFIIMATPAIAQDTKGDFKYSDGTIEKLVVWKKLAECAAFFSASSEFIAYEDEELALEFYNKYESAYFTSKEILKADRKINDDDVINIVINEFNLEKYGAESALLALSPGYLINDEVQDYIETSFDPCNDFLAKYIK